MKGTLTLERHSPTGLLLARHKQPMRSWTFPLFQVLYAQFSALNAPNVSFPHYGLGTVLTNATANGPIMGAGGSPLWGHQQYGNAGPNSWFDAMIPGDMVGIQVGVGNTPVDSADFALDEKLCPTFGESVRCWDAPNNDPWGVCTDGTWIYIVDSGNQMVYQCNRLTGAINNSWASPGGGAVFPYCITYDPVTTHLFIGCDDGNVYEQTTAGANIGNWAYPANIPMGVCYDTVTGHLFFVDTGQNVREITTAGVPVNVWAHGHGANVYGIAYDSVNDQLILLDHNVVNFWVMTKAGGAVSGPWHLPHWMSTYGCCFDGHFLWVTHNGGGGEQLIAQVCVMPDNFQYGGMELVDLTIADPNAQFTLRRFFTNMTGGAVSIEEVGIWMGCSLSGLGYGVVQAARDVVAPAVNVLNTELLRVTYTPQITV